MQGFGIELYPSDEFERLSRGVTTVTKREPTMWLLVAQVNSNISITMCTLDKVFSHRHRYRGTNRPKEQIEEVVVKRNERDRNIEKIRAR